MAGMAGMAVHQGHRARKVAWLGALFLLTFPPSFVPKVRSLLAAVGIPTGLTFCIRVGWHSMRKAKCITAQHTPTNKEMGHWSPSWPSGKLGKRTRAHVMIATKHFSMSPLLGDSVHCWLEMISKARTQQRRNKIIPTSKTPDSDIKISEHMTQTEMLN